VRTQYLLLLAYATFVVASLWYWAFDQQAHASHRIEPALVEDWEKRAAEVADLARAQQLSIEVVDALQVQEAHTRNAGSLLHAFIAFALLATLPLAAYAGQTMRDKLFVTRPVKMPRVVYWTLFGVSTRKTAVRYMWLSVILALCSSAVALITPIGFLGLASLITAYLYHYAIEWVDKNAYWANETMAPFPFPR